MKRDLSRMPERLSPTAANDLRGIAAEFGIRLDPIDDFRDLATMHILAERMESPGSVTDHLKLLDTPIRCGEVNIYRLTFEAIFWLEDFKEWYDDDALTGCATIFAMATCRDENAFDGLWEPKPARRAVRKWARHNRRRISVDAFERAAGVLFPDPSFIPAEDNPAGFGHIMAVLLAEIGHTKDYWLREVSADFACEIVGRLSAIKWAEQGGEGDNPYSEYELATREYHHFKQNLIKRHMKKQVKADAA